MSDETTKTGADLFRDTFSAGEGGGFFKPTNGFMAIGEFTGCSDAGEQEFEGKKSRGIWWHFDLYKHSKPEERVTYVVADGEEKGQSKDAVADGRTTDALGPKSKARAWYEALLKRPIANGEKTPGVYAEAVGKRALLVFGPSTGDKDKIVLAQVLPYSPEE